MPKLSDTQLVILSTAAARDDGAVLPLPDSLKIKGGAVTSVLKSQLKKGLIAEQPAAPGAEVWRESDDGGRMTLAITDTGLRAIGVAPEGEIAGAETVDKPAPRKSNRRAARPKTAPTSDITAPPSVRTGTKTALLIDLLKRKDGACIDEIVAATGWQAHSVRGAISGTLKKKLGLTIASEKQENRSQVYRISGTA